MSVDVNYQAIDKKVSEVIDSIIEAEKKYAVEGQADQQCDSCHEYFKSTDALSSHKTERRIRRVGQNTRGAKIAIHNCPVCGEKFTKNTLLLRHQRGRCTEHKKSNYALPMASDEVREKAFHSGPVVCDICHKTFKKKRYLRVHMRLHACPRICDVCGAALASEWCLEQHMRRHNSDYSLFCEICKKGFYYRATLNVHMTSHTKEKTVACDICKRAFANRIYLRSHMRTHLDPETRKKFKCDICKFETFYSYCYKEHKETHTGEGRIECEHCGKHIRRQYMKTHVKTHTGEKAEICEFCGKGFISRKYLAKHRRIHTGERPYRCFICDNSFTQRSSLTKHLKTHENDSDASDN